MVQLELPDTLQYRVACFDLQGRKLHEWNASGPILEWSVENWPSGLYQVFAFGEHQDQTLRQVLVVP